LIIYYAFIMPNSHCQQHVTQMFRDCYNPVAMVCPRFRGHYSDPILQFPDSNPNPPPAPTPFREIPAQNPRFPPETPAIPAISAKSRPPFRETFANLNHQIFISPPKNPVPLEPRALLPYHPLVHPRQSP